MDFLLVLHLIIAVALIGVVLVQKSEGGALGIGGGGGGGGLMSARGAANFLTRLTAILAGIFMLTSLGLTVLANSGGSGSIVDRIEAQQAPTLVPSEPGRAGARTRHLRDARIGAHHRSAARSTFACPGKLTETLGSTRRRCVTTAPFGMLFAHGAVYLHHRRRGLLARQRSGFGGTRCPAAGAWLFRTSEEARPFYLNS